MSYFLSNCFGIREFRASSSVYKRYPTLTSFPDSTWRYCTSSISQALECTVPLTEMPHLVAIDRMENIIKTLNGPLFLNGFAFRRAVFKFTFSSNKIPLGVSVALVYSPHSISHQSAPCHRLNSPSRYC